MFFGLFDKRTKNKVKKPSFITDWYGNTRTNDQDGTAFACIDRVASELAMLNFGVFSAETHRKIKGHNIETLLKRPNGYEGHFIFLSQSVIDYFNGGVFWLKSVIGGKLSALFRLNPKNVVIFWNPVTNNREFHYNGQTFYDEEIIYIPSRYGYNVLKSHSIFDAIKPVFDTANSLNDYTSNTFSNGLNGKHIVIDIAKALPDATSEQIRSLKDSFKNEYAGIENAGRPLIKKDGIEYAEIGGSTNDNRAAELSENRKFQEHEVSKIFGVPEELLNVSSSTNLENVFTLFSEFAIRPLATQIQDAINELLDEDKEYFEFDFNGVMKVSMQQRIDAYSKELQIGLLSPNEARAKENLEPIEAGDNHFMPANLMPLNDDTINAYMAKQKNEINGNNSGFGQGADQVNPTDENSQHSLAGDDKQ